MVMSDVAEYFLSSTIVLCPDDNLLSCASIAFGKRYNNILKNNNNNNLDGL